MFLPPAKEVWGKVIFSEACVKNSVHKGSAWLGGMHGWGACMAGGRAWPGGMHGWGGGHVWLGGACVARMPPPSLIPRDTVGQ